MIELLSTSQRAPTKAQQKAAIREDGTQPEKTFEAPADYELLPLTLGKGEDILCVAHLKVLGTMRIAATLLEMLGGRQVPIKLPNEDPITVETEEDRLEVLGRMTATPWGKGTVRQSKGRGRPPKRRQPNEQQLRMLRAAWFDPDNYERRIVKDMAAGWLGREVQIWELKHWFGPSRTPKADEGGGDE